ncbi:hypothetical protein [Paenibacillus chitinolyticus]
MDNLEVFCIGSQIFDRNENEAIEMRLAVNLSEDLLNEEALKEGLAVIRWIEENGYTSNLVFFVNKEPVIIIESNQIKSISSPEDLKKFKMRM